MRLSRALCIAVTALAAVPASALGHLPSEGDVSGATLPTATAASPGSPGPSLAALRARSRPGHVGGQPAYSLANGCYALRSKLLRQLVVEQGDGSYRASATRVKDAEPFRMQATALGSYLLYGSGQDFLGIDSSNDIRSADQPSNTADWQVAVSRRRGFMIHSRSADKVLAVSRDNGELVLADPKDAGKAARFTFQRARGCARYPEATVNATGKPFRGTNSHGEVVGFLEAHQHLMFFEAFGGEFHCGRPWHRFGVKYALPDCARIEGPRAANAPVQNFLNYGNPARTHDTVGWPTFNDWPGPHMLTYEGVYYKWLERAWRGGLRTYVALNTDNKALCDVYTASHPIPPARHGCNEMDSVRLQIADVYDLRDYIDAQNGGPGKGWFRIVKSPSQARRVIEDGKLAVILGIETSKPLDCGVFNQVPQCDERQIDVELQRIYDMGVRQMELINKFDNAFGGAAGDAGTTGVIVNNGNFKETGRYWDMRTCHRPGHDQPQPTGIPHTDIGLAFGALQNQFGAFAPVYPPPPHCNHLALTHLGAYMIRRMMARGMIVDPDHLSVRARDEALTLMEHEKYPGVISSHSWADVEAYPRIHKLGGVVTPYAGDSTGFVKAWRQNRDMPRKHGQAFGFGYGSDMHGLGAQGGPRGGPHPVHYPFKSADGSITLRRSHAGDRVFDINVDGVADYALYPDWIQDLRMIAGDRIIKDMSRGAETYLDMWKHATDRSQELHSLGD